MKTNKKLLLATLTASVLSGAPVVQATETATAPNVLFIAVDDMNDWINPITKNRAHTPNFDKLAARGVTFTQAQAPASYCSPSRNAIMTGMAAYNSGLYGDTPVSYNQPDVITLPKHFQDNGYYTAGTGKVYHHMPGFLVLDGFDDYYIWKEENKKKGWYIDSWGKGTPHPYNGKPGEVGQAVYKLFDVGTVPNDQEVKMSDTIHTRWAEDFVKGYDKDQPFFLAYGLYAPHKPNYIPQKYVDMYPLEDIVVPSAGREGVMDDIDQSAALFKRMNFRKNNHYLPVKENGFEKKVIQHYLASISYADAMVGRVLDALDKSGKADNTVVVFWSDNGYHQGEKMVYAKHTMWERTGNVPFIWAGPKIPKGVKYDGVVSLLDSYKTLIDLTETDTSRKDIDGESLMSIFKKPAVIQDRKTFMTGKHEDIAITSNEYRYIKLSDGIEAFYDTKKDAAEDYNLIESSEHKKQIDEFRDLVPQMAPYAEQVKHKRNGSLKLTKKGETYKWVQVSK